MDNIFWHQQINDQPLYPDILWSQPEHKSMAGKLAIVGGNLHKFTSASNVYNAATKAGVGAIRILLPNSLAKTISPIWPECEFGPANKSGSFSLKSLAEWIDLASWSDNTIISGDLSHNSEISILLEQFISQNKKPLTLMGDSLDFLINNPLGLFNDQPLTLALEFNQLQHLLTAIRYPTALKSTMNLYQIADLMHSLSSGYPLTIVTTHLDQIMLTYDGQVYSTINKNNVHLLEVATASTVWRLQQPDKAFAAMTCGIYYLLNN